MDFSDSPTWAALPSPSQAESVSMKYERLVLGRASAVLFVAFTLARCGSSGDSTPNVAGNMPGGGLGENSENPAPETGSEVPGSIPGDPNDEGNPDDLPLGPTTGSPSGSTTQPGTAPVDPTQPPGPANPQTTGTGFANVENLDRGIIAVLQGDGVYIGWRMFGYEYDRENPGRISYNLYRNAELIENVTDSTNFQDDEGTAESSYSVSVVIDGVEGPRSNPVGPLGQNFLRVPLQSPGAIYNAHDSSVGDVDGDGQYEIIMLWEPNNARDNSQAGVTSNVFIDALRLDGKRLWRIDLGPNLRAGEHYNQFVVIDADGDGKAELGIKTAPGTRDGTGALLSKGPAANDDDDAVYRNADGYVLAGPEFHRF